MNNSSNNIYKLILSKEMDQKIETLACECNRSRDDIMTIGIKLVEILLAAGKVGMHLGLVRDKTKLDTLIVGIIKE